MVVDDCWLLQFALIFKRGVEMKIVYAEAELTNHKLYCYKVMYGGEKSKEEILNNGELLTLLLLLLKIFNYFAILI